MSGERKSEKVDLERVEATDDLRRKLLKASAVAVPAIVSLQSGTAWALSSCASHINRPTVDDINSLFGDFRSNPTSTQQQHRDFVTSMTGLPEFAGGDGKKTSKGHGHDDDDNYCAKDDNPNDLQTVVCDCAAPGSGTYPEGPGDTVEPCEMVHLLVTNGSCWASFCNGPINGTMDVSIDGDTSPSVCSGSNRRIQSSDMSTGMHHDQGLPDTTQVRLAAEGVLVWRSWDDGCSIFNRATGETHFLDLWTSYLLRLIEQGPASEAALASRMAEELALDRDERLDLKLSATLRNFEAMALVELCPGG